MKRDGEPTGAVGNDTNAGRAIGLTPDGRLRSGRLAGLSMGRAIWVLSWPILVESFLQSLVGLTDTMIAARLDEGAAATDAIGGASYIVWFIGLCLMAVGVGATALISRSVGAGRMGVANAMLGQTMLLGTAVGLLVGVVVAFSAAPVARVLGLSEQAASAYSTYMLIVASGVPLMSLVVSGSACARGAGDSLRPLLAMIAINLVNIPGSWVLSGADITSARVVDGELQTRVIFENPFPFDLGIAGIGLGTVTGHLIGALIILRMARSGTWGIRLRRMWLRPHLVSLVRLLRLGIPNFLETFGLWIGNFLIILMVGWLGVMSAGDVGYLGAHLVAVRIEAFSFMPGFAMGAAAATLTGQYLGAGSALMARRAVVVCTIIAAGVMGALGLVFILCPVWLVGVISSQSEHLELAPRLVFICGLVQVPFGVAIVTRAALRGAGDVRIVMALTWFTTYGVRLPMAYAMSGVDLYLPGELVIQNPFRDDPSLAGLWAALCIELAIRGVVFAIRFVQGGWVRSQV